MPVIWDYHVILHSRRGNMIYDFDSQLGFPCPVDVYVRETMHPEIRLNPQFERYLFLTTYIECWSEAVTAVAVVFLRGVLTTFV